MAHNMSFKEFMDNVEIRLESYSQENLRKIFMRWAQNTQPAKRGEFLERLVLPEMHSLIEVIDDVQHEEKPNDETLEEEMRDEDDETLEEEMRDEDVETLEEELYDDELLNEIEGLAERVENGDYCEGWGWDHDIHEERDWGDESWAEEIDAFFSRAHEAVLDGYYNLARNAYEKLFDILDMGEKPGHLPGSPDPADMLDTDLKEEHALYIRAVYLSSSPDERAVNMLEAMQRFSHDIGKNLNLQSVVDAGRERLPDINRFLSDWIDILKDKDDAFISHLIREAVLLYGGIPAISDFARKEGKRFPRAYSDWIKALEKEGDFHSALEAANVGLTNIPGDYAVRAEIAEGKVRAGKNLGDLQIQLAGWKEAFYSKPSLDYLLSLLDIAGKTGCYNQEIEAAIARIISLLQKEKSHESTFPYNDEQQKSSASEKLLNEAYLVSGQYEKSFMLVSSKKEFSGWGYGNDPEGLSVSFFLVLLSKSKRTYFQNIGQAWKEAVSKVGDYYYGRQETGEQFKKEMDKIFQSIILSEDEESRYLSWCIEKIGAKVDGIVGGQQRNSYDKAACLLSALAEMLANRGEKSQGVCIIEKYRQKYPRHSSFKKELDLALNKSRL